MSNREKIEAIRQAWRELDPPIDLDLYAQVAINVLTDWHKRGESGPGVDRYKPGDQVRILVGGPHENMGRIATVNQILEHNGNVVVYLDDNDEDEWVYAPGELSLLSKADR